MLIELKKWLSNGHVIVFNGIRWLNPGNKNFWNEDQDLFSFTKLHDADIRDRTHEKYQVKRLIERKNKEDTESPKSALQFCWIPSNHLRRFFKNFTKYGKFYRVVLPVTTVSCERSFSCLKLIKTDLRTTSKWSWDLKYGEETFERVCRLLC